MRNLAVEKHTIVAISYTLLDDKGQILDLASPDAPLIYLQGAGVLLPAVEAALEGKCAKEQLFLALSPEEAYGAFEPRRVHKVPLAALEVEGPLRPGMPFVMEGPGGLGSQAFFVKGVDGDMVELDGNHPLAGRSLRFDITVEFVRNPSPAERAARRPLEGQPNPKRL